MKIHSKTLHSLLRRELVLLLVHTVVVSFYTEFLYLEIKFSLRRWTCAKLTSNGPEMVAFTC